MGQTHSLSRAGGFVRAEAMAGAGAARRLPMFLLLSYLVVEYGRPSFLAPLKPGIVLIALLVLCLVPRMQEVEKILKERYFRLYAALLGLMAVHVVIAANNYYAFMTLKTIFTYLIIALCCCVFLDSTEKIRKFLFFFILVSFLCAVNRIADTNFLGISAKGVFGDENDFALIMNVALPISFFLARLESGWKKWFLWTACMIFVLGNVDQSSRGGVLGMAAVAFGCFYFVRNKAAAAVVIAILAGLAWTMAPPAAKEDFKSIGFDSADKDTGKDRIELWKVALRAFSDNPIIGLGQGNIGVAMPRYQSDEQGKSFWKRNMWGRATHSAYFTMLPELGLVGVVILLLMMRVLLAKWRAVRQFAIHSNHPAAEGIRSINTALVISMVGFLVSAAFLSVLYYPPFWNISGVLMALWLVSAKTLGGTVRGKTGSPRS